MAVLQSVLTSLVSIIFWRSSFGGGWALFRFFRLTVQHLGGSCDPHILLKSNPSFSFSSLAKLGERGDLISFFCSKYLSLLCPSRAEDGYLNFYLVISFESPLT